MFVLGIESSCDDTSVAIVSDTRKILTNIVLPQNHNLHKGVVPEIAARKHMNNMLLVINQSLSNAKIKLKDINHIASTGGPGLIGGVIISTMFGKGLSSVLNKPFIAVNHLEGHILTARLTDNVDFPYLILLVSGGNSQFIIAHDLGKYEIIGETLDDAVGEAFDKVAKLLDLEYPGGPIIEKMAKNGDKNKYNLPLSMINKQGCNMSFSGIKTAVKNLIQNILPLDDQKIYDLCASFQNTISNILYKKSEIAIELFLKQYHGIKNNAFVISGGVGSNIHIKTHLQELTEKFGIQLVVPPANLCTDNAAMIAWAGIERAKKGLFSSLDFCPKAKWSVDKIN